MDKENTGPSAGRSQDMLDEEAASHIRALMPDLGPLPYEIAWSLSTRIIGGRAVGLSKPDDDGWYRYTGDGLGEVVPIVEHQRLPPPELLPLHRHKKIPPLEFAALLALDLPVETRFPVFLHWSEVAKGTVLHFTPGDFSKDTASARIRRCAALLESGPRRAISPASSQVEAPDYLRTWLEAPKPALTYDPTIDRGSYRGRTYYHFSVRYPWGGQFSAALRWILGDLGYTVADDPYFLGSDEHAWLASVNGAHIEDVLPLMRSLADNPLRDREGEKTLSQKLAELPDVHFFDTDWKHLSTTAFRGVELDYGCELYWTAELDVIHITLVLI